MVNVPATIDLIQEESAKQGVALAVPEIRVWLHPHLAGQPGDDYCKKFASFQEALDFIRANKPEAEEHPLLAFAGREMNLWGIQPPITQPPEPKEEDNKSIGPESLGLKEGEGAKSAGDIEISCLANGYSWIRQK